MSLFNSWVGIAEKQLFTFPFLREHDNPTEAELRYAMSASNMLIFALMNSGDAAFPWKKESQAKE